MVFWIVMMIACIALNAAGLLLNLPWVLCVGLFLTSIDGFGLYVAYSEYKKYKEAERILNSHTKFLRG